MASSPLASFNAGRMEPTRTAPAPPLGATSSNGAIRPALPPELIDGPGLIGRVRSQRQLVSAIHAGLRRTANTSKPAFFRSQHGEPSSRLNLRRAPGGVPDGPPPGSTEGHRRVVTRDVRVHALNAASPFSSRPYVLNYSEVPDFPGELVELSSNRAYCRTKDRLAGRLSEQYSVNRLSNRTLHPLWPETRHILLSWLHMTESICR